jgi:hypothetical protein
VAACVNLNLCPAYDAHTCPDLPSVHSPRFASHSHHHHTPPPHSGGPDPAALAAVLRKGAETDRALMEVGCRAFVSLLRGYKEHACRFVFRLQVCRALRVLQLVAAHCVLHFPLTLPLRTYRSICTHVHAHIRTHTHTHPFISSQPPHTPTASFLPCLSYTCHDPLTQHTLHTLVCTHSFMVYIPCCCLLLPPTHV